MPPVRPSDYETDDCATEATEIFRTKIYICIFYSKFGESVSLVHLIIIFDEEEVQAVPECEEGEADKESERSAELRYEGDDRVDPGLLLIADVRRHVVVAQHEQT